MRFATLAGLATALTLAGCASFSGGPDPLVSANDEIAALESSFDSDQVLAYFAAPPGSPTRTNLRNQIVSTRLYALDLRFADYVRDLSKELRGGAFGADALSIALTGAATIIDPSTATTVLAGIDTAIKGARQAFNKEILVEQTLPVLLTQMQADRTRVATQIWYSLANRSDSEYPLPLALAQLQDYYRAGTIAGALISVNESASQSAAAASEDFSSKVLQVQFGENRYTRILNEYINAAPNADEETRRLQQVQAEIDKAGEQVLAPFLINSNDQRYRPLQKRIVENLNLGGN